MQTKDQISLARKFLYGMMIVGLFLSGFGKSSHITTDTTQIENLQNANSDQEYSINIGDYPISPELVESLKLKLPDIQNQSGNATSYGVIYYEEHPQWAWINLSVTNGELYNVDEIGPMFLLFSVKTENNWVTTLSSEDMEFISLLDQIDRNNLSSEEIKLLSGYYYLNTSEDKEIHSLAGNLLFPWPNTQNNWTVGSLGFHSAGFTSLGAESGAFAIDLIPPSSLPSATVLAMESGAIVNKLECTWNTVLIVRHDGYADSKKFVYLHIQNGTSKGIGIINRGDTLGTLRIPTMNGTCSGYSCEIDNNPNTGNLCSQSTGRHLHLGFGTDKNIVIDGRVLATLSPGNSLASSNTSSGGNTSLNPPSLQSPSAGQTLNNRSVNFTWQSPSATNQNGYTFRLSTSSNPDTQPWIKDTGLGNEYTSYSHTFSSDGTFYWHMRTWNTSGQASSWTTRSFNINSTTPPPAGNWNAKYFSGADHWWDNNNFNNKMCEQNFTSTHLDRNYGSGSPCGNSTTDNWVAEYNTTINFPSGSYVFYAQNDDGLKIWVNGSNIMERGGSSGYYPRCPALNLNGNVPIRAILREEGGDARVKIAWSTDTSVCIPPGSFNKSSPSSGSTGISTSPTLSWGSSSNATGYYYCIDTSNNNNCDTGWQNNGTATSKILSGLTAGATYYWQARANNQGGEVFGNSGAWWAFTVAAPQSAPTLSSPTNNTTLNRTDNATLSWNTASGAPQYYAEFWGGPGINVNSGWTSGTSWALGSQWGGVYQWRVKAKNGSGQESGWSETRTLNIRTGTPSNLTATALSSDQIALTWSKSSDGPGNVDGYRIYRNGSAIGTVPGSSTTYQNNGLSCGTGYSFYVKAYKGAIESNASNTVNTTTQVCPPAIRATAADTRDGDWGLKTSFNPGDTVQWTVHVENTTGADAQVVLGFTVKNPGNVVIHNSTHTVTTGAGALMWGLPSTVGLPGGTYTLIGSVTYQGVKTERVTTYTVVGPTTVTSTLTSTASHDGHVLESTETSNKGGTQNSKASTFFLGDDAANKQYRTILSFNTTLPSNATITKVTLKIKNAGMAGTNPFSTHGKLLVDVRKGGFSNNNTLQLGDFNAAASKASVGNIPKTLSGGWYTKVWTSGIFDYINKAGVTQFRLRFAKDDNNDFGADYLKIYSGNAGATSRPQLIIEYFIP